MDLSQRPPGRSAQSVSCHIYADGAGWWRWEGVDSVAAVVECSLRSFETRAECWADAKKHAQRLPKIPIVF